MKILDLSSGKRAVWFNKNHPLCTFLDKRESVNPDFICDTIKGTAKEAHRITKINGLMALKWNCSDIKLQRVFDLMPQWEPLFGHLTKDGPRSQTYWVMLRRLDV